jgi:ADP-ribose pyrophosphatase YjhB (NUDIX family)
MTFRPVVHGVRVLAFDGDCRILLVRHSYGSARWLPPGGGLRRGEDPVIAASRELYEETGCVLADGRLAVLADEDFHGARNHVRVVAGRTTGVPVPDGREIIEAAFFAVDDLPAHLPKGLAVQIEDCRPRE